MYNKKLLGAIILNYNDFKRSYAQMTRLLGYSIFDEIVIVDNNSSEDLDKLKEIKINKVSLIFSNKNLGYGGGNNLGLRKLYQKKVDYVLLINNDILMQKESIIDCVEFMINHREFSASTPQMIEKGKIKRNFYDIPTFRNTLNFISSTFSKKCKSMKIYDDYLTAEYVRESATIYSLEALYKIGFFDENIFMYEEGPSTGFLFRKFGYKEAVLLKTKPYIHNHIGWLINRKLFAMNKKSRIYFFKNYLHYGKLKIFIFRIFWLNIFLK